MSGITILGQPKEAYFWEATNITITPFAMQKFAEACKDEQKPALRIGVKGGRMFSVLCII